MKKDITELPAGVQAQIRALDDLPEDEIDTTDAPEFLDWSDARRGVFYRPVKQQITLRLDAEMTLDTEMLESSLTTIAAISSAGSDWSTNQGYAGGECRP